MTYTIMPDYRVEFEPSPRWVRVYFNHQLIADSKEMMLLRQSNHLPLYYFPKKHVQMDYLQQSNHSTPHSELRGKGIFWHVQVSNKIANNAAFTFQNLPGNGPQLEDYIAFEWNKMDSWFEEDVEVFVYARDPHKRVDVLHSSRHIKVMIDDIEIANSKHPQLLFETGLPTRYYFSPHDVRMNLLEHSDIVTRCPYKGEAQLYSLKNGDTLHENIAWTYRYPTLECLKIQGLISFLNEKVDIYEDGKLLSRPKTPWS